MGKVKPKYVESSAIGDILVGIIDERGKHISSVIPVGEVGSVLVSNGTTPEWSTANVTVGLSDNIFGSTSSDMSTQPLMILPATTRTDAETVRDLYAVANPSWLLYYDTNPFLHIFLYFVDGTDSKLVSQTRLGEEWVDNLSTVGIQGVPGSASDFSNVPPWSIPMIGADPDRKPMPSGIIRTQNGTGPYEFDEVAIFPRDSIQIGYSGSISAFGELIKFNSFLTGRSGIHPFQYVDPITGSERPVEVSVGAAERINTQPIFTDVCPNSGSFVAPSSILQVLSKVYLRLPVGTGATGLRIRLTAVGQPNPYFYYPSKNDWDEGTGATFTDTGNNPNEIMIDVTDAPFIEYEDLDITVDYATTTGNLLGVGTIPFFGVSRQPITFIPLARQEETTATAIKNNLQSLTGDSRLDQSALKKKVFTTTTNLEINSSNVAQYINNSILAIQSSGTVTISIDSSVIGIGDKITIGHFNNTNNDCSVTVSMLNGTVDGITTSTIFKNTSKTFQASQTQQLHTIGEYFKPDTVVNGVQRLDSQNIRVSMVNGTYVDLKSPETLTPPNKLFWFSDTNILNISQVASALTTSPNSTVWNPNGNNDVSLSISDGASRYIYSVITAFDTVETIYDMAVPASPEDLGSVFVGQLLLNGVTYNVHRSSVHKVYGVSTKNFRIVSKEHELDHITWQGLPANNRQMVLGTGTTEITGYLTWGDYAYSDKQIPKWNAASGQIEPGYELFGGRTVATTAPSNTQIPVWINATQQWTPQWTPIGGYYTPSSAPTVNYNTLNYFNGAWIYGYPRPDGKQFTLSGGTDNDFLVYDQSNDLVKLSSSPGSCLARRCATAQSVPNYTEIVVQFDAVDTEFEHLAAASGLTYVNGVFTNTSGKPITINISYMIQWDASFSGFRAAWLRFSGISSKRLAYDLKDAISSGITVSSNSVSVTIQPNDYFSVVCYHTSSFTRTINNGGDGLLAGYAGRIQITRIR